MEQWRRAATSVDEIQQALACRDRFLRSVGMSMERPQTAEGVGAVADQKREESRPLNASFRPGCQRYLCSDALSVSACRFLAGTGRLTPLLLSMKSGSAARVETASAVSRGELVRGFPARDRRQAVPPASRQEASRVRILASFDWRFPCAM